MPQVSRRGLGSYEAMLGSMVLVNQTEDKWSSERSE